jgi:uncharacterized protein DUF4339
MYKILGGDGKEYGPVSGAQLRQWMSEGRVNLQTKVQVEGESEWKALGSIPEFSNAARPAFTPPGLPPLSPPPGGDAAARSAVRAPAIALIVTAILNLLLGVLSLVYMKTAEEFYAGLPEFSDPERQQTLHLMFGPLGTASVVVGIVMSIVILIGAMRMQAAKNYAFAFTGCILAMIPCVTPCCFIGLPFGIWGLVVLCRPAVKSQFG